MVCPHHDRIADRRGCRGKPAPDIVLREEYNGKEICYWNCPKLFIPYSVIEWHKIYKYNKDFPGASMPSITEQNGRFLKAYYIYEQHIAEFKKQMNEKK